MHSRQGVGIVAGLCGALAGAFSMHLFQDRLPSQTAGGGHDDLTALQQRMDSTDALLHEIKRQIESIEVAQYHALSSQADATPVTPSKDDEAVRRRDVGVAAGPDIAVEDAVVSNIITRLYDPAYSRSTSLAEVMNSEEMIDLSDESRQRVIAEMVGMLNRGEIDADTFFPGGAGR